MMNTQLLRGGFYFLALLATPLLATSVYGAAPKSAFDAPQLIIDARAFLGRVNSVSISRDNRFIVATGDKEVRIWNVQTGQLIHTLRGERSRGDFGTTWDAVFTPDTRELVVAIDDKSGDGALRRYDVGDFRTLKNIIKGNNTVVRRLSFSNDGSKLATAEENGTVRIFNYRTSPPSVAHTLPSDGTNRSIYSLMEFADTPLKQHELLVYGIGNPWMLNSINGTTREVGGNYQFDAGFFQCMVSLFGNKYTFRNNNQSISVNPNHGLYQNFAYSVATQRFAMAHGDKNSNRYEVVVLPFRGNNAICSYNGHTAPISCLRFTKDWKYGVSGDESGEVHLWNATTGNSVYKLTRNCKPVYKAAFIKGFSTKENGLRVGINFSPNSDRFKQVFNFNTRSLENAKNSYQYLTEQQRNAQYSINTKVVSNGENEPLSIITCTDSNGFTKGKHILPLATYFGKTTLINNEVLGARPAVIMTDSAYGTLACWDGRRTDHLLNRLFVGHSNQITSLSVSEDSRYLLSSGVDGTIRLWSLENRKPLGTIDCRLLSNKVEEIYPGSQTERAGFRVGDMILKIGKFDLMEVEEQELQGTYPYRPGDNIPVLIERNGRQQLLNVTLVQGADVVEPLLSAYFLENDDWIIFTPEGYFVCTPDASNAVGWVVNRGKQASADFYPLNQFKDQFYRQDVIDEIINSGSFSQTSNKLDLDSGSTSDIINSVPRLEIFGPQSTKIPSGASITLSDNKYLINYKATCTDSSQLKSVIITLNGAEISRSNLSGTKVEDSYLFQSLKPGKNKITLTARSRGEIYSEPVHMEVNVPGVKNTKPGKLYVLAIGVSDYETVEPDLKYAAKDAEQFVNQVTRMTGHFSDREPHINILTNQKATSNNIKTSLYNYKKAKSPITEDDILIIFLSGHGTQDTSTTKHEYYFMTHNTNVETLPISAVPWGDFRDCLQQCRAGKKILFIDTCHAGAAISHHDQIQDLVGHNVVVFASSNAREKSDEILSLQNSVFTKALLNALENPQSIDKNPQIGLLDTQEISKGIAIEMDKLNASHRPLFYPSVPPKDFQILQVSQN